MDIRFLDEYRIIAIKKSENGAITMPKAGRILHNELACELEKRGYSLPAKYVIGWNDKMNSWVGILQEVPEAPSLRKSKKSKLKIAG